MNPAWTALIAAAVTLVVAYLNRRWNVFDRVDAASAKVRVRAIDHTETLLEHLRAEIDRLQTRVESLEQEREAWRAERVVFESERLELTARVEHLELKLAAAGIDP